MVAPLCSKAGMQRLCLCLASAALAAGMPCVLKREAGIRCDGTVDDTNSFQTLLNNCSTVTVTTDAHCVTLPVQMPSHRELIIQTGAMIQAAPHHSWPLRDKLVSTRPLLSSTNTVNITIRGDGEIDGRGAEWWPRSKLDARPRPRLLTLNNVTGVLLEGLTLTNPAFWCVLLGGSNMRVAGVRIRAPPFSVAPNTDGIDIAARNVHIVDVDISNGDDSICIKSPSANVLVERSVVRQGNGFVIGTASSGLPGSSGDTFDVRNVTFRDSVAIDTTFGCHVKAKSPQHGVVRNVTFSNITVTQTKNATEARVADHDWAGYAIGIHLLDQGRRRRLHDADNAASSSTVVAENVTFRHIRSRGLYAGQFVCSASNATIGCKGLLFEDVKLNVTRSGCQFVGVEGRSHGQVTPPSCAL